MDVMNVASNDQEFHEDLIGCLNGVVTCQIWRPLRDEQENMSVRQAKAIEALKIG